MERRMKIVIAGGSGFLGAPLAEMYAEEGHDVRVLTRSLMAGDTRHDPGTGVPGITRVGWKPDGKSGPWAAVLDSADAVINLAGESIAAKRWTPQRKAILRDSRLLATRSLASALAAAPRPPAVFISGSAVGFYGPSGPEPKPEEAPAGDDFLAHLCEDWEAAALSVSRARNADGHPAHGHRAGTNRRGASADDAAFPFLRRRPAGIRHASTCPGFTASTGSRWCAGSWRRRPSAGPLNATAPDAGHEPRVRTRARPRHAPAEPAAGARFRAQSWHSARWRSPCS